MIYLLTLLLFIVPVLRFDLMRKDGAKSAWYVCLCVWLILLAGLRYRVGGDTLSYMDSFESECVPLGRLARFDFENAPWNPLWYVFCSVFKTFGDSFFLLQLGHAAILNIAVFRFFRRYCPDCYFTAALVYFFGYFCYFNMEVLRESLCIALLLYAYPLIESRRYLPYCLVVIVAVFIHTSAIILFLIPLAHLLLRILKTDRFWFAFLLVAGVVFVLKVVDVISLVLYSTFDGATAEKIRGYASDGESSLAGMLVLFLSILPYLATMYVRNLNGYTRFAMFGILTYFIMLFQTMSFSLAFMARFSNYFVLFGIVYVVNTFITYYWDFHYRVFSRIVMNCVLLTMFVNLSYFYVRSRNEILRGTHVYNRYIPYHSIFDQESDKTRERLRSNEIIDM